MTASDWKKILTQLKNKPEKIQRFLKHNKPKTRKLKTGGKFTPADESTVTAKEKQKKKKTKTVYGNKKRAKSVEVECFASRNAFIKGVRYYVRKEILEKYPHNLKKVK